MQGKYLSRRTEKIQLSAIREVLTKVENAKRQGIEISNLSVGRPDFDTPQHIKEATKKAIDDGLVHYTSSAGLHELREAVCKRMEADYQLGFDPDQVLITAGATEAIYVGLQSILNPADEVLVPEPMYVYYKGWSDLAQSKCVGVPLREEDNYLLKAKEVDKRITANTKALILTSPHNPTGQVFEKGDLEALGKLAVEKDFLIICDDIYNKLLYDDVEYFSIAKVPGVKDRTLIIGSFSKCYAMDGWRIGYLIAPREIISGALKMHQHAISCSNTFVQIGAATALTGSQDCVREMVAEFDRRRRLVMSSLSDMNIPFVRPRGAFYIFPSVKQFGMTSQEFSNFLFEEARTAVVPGNAFGRAGEGNIRISYAASYDEIEKCMQRVRDAVRKI
jgi:aspartate/methionine/tyrosine aminotransferase